MFKIICIAFLVNYCESARILGAVFTPSYSHQLSFQPLWKELSKRGHHVTVLTTNPINDPSLENLREINLNVSYEVMKSFKTDEILSQKNESSLNRFNKYMDALNAVADKQLSHPEVQNLIHDGLSAKFDLLMVEVTYPTQMALAWYFQVPFIGLISYDAPPRIHSAMGNPVNPALYPDSILPFDKDLTFLQRLVSVMVYVVLTFYGNFVLYPREDLTVRKHFGKQAPTLSEIQKNMSMLFVSTNPVLNTIRPLGPTTIQIGGGIHIQGPVPLHKDLQSYLDDAKEGFIYFSLGTNVKSSSLEQHVKEAIVEALSEIPYKVLWKFEDQHMANKPENVKIIDWVPSQTAVLDHKNIKAFITQCGLQSLEEAIYYGVPLIGLPFYGDQRNNAKIIESKGMGIILEPSKLDKEEFKDAIVNVTTNISYTKKIEEISLLYKDVPISSLEKAVWWTEYVIRHKGADHLRPEALNIPFYQYFLLDVIAFIAITLLGLAMVTKRLICMLKRKEKND